MGFKENDIFQSKEYSIISKIKKIFKNLVINEQYRVDKYFIDLAFPVHKLGIEIDENGHVERIKVKEREKIKEAGFKSVRINPDKENFDIFDEIGEIEDLFYESGRKLAKE